MGYKYYTYCSEVGHHAPHMLSEVDAAGNPVKLYCTGLVNQDAEIGIRTTALNAAVEITASPRGWAGDPTDIVIERAKKFEAYLKGAN